MQYLYTNENDVSVRIHVTYGELKKIWLLLGEQKDEEGKVKWGCRDLHEELGEILRSAAKATHAHYACEKEYSLKNGNA